MPSNPRREFLDAEGVTRLPLAVVKVSRRRFKLVVFLRQSNLYAKTFSCPIAIGAIGFETPPGVYAVLGKESPPTYTAPDEKWARDAGFTPGEKLPADHPANPLRGAFFWLNNEGIGIHGTGNLLSLRSKASHGCIRVRPDDAIWLFDNLPLGTIVLVQ